jgi:predicted transcriptional regulator
MKKMIAEFNKMLDIEGKSLEFECSIDRDAALLNFTRCEIYEYLCFHPCSSVTRIARKLRLTESSVRWHLKKLVLERLVGFNKDGSTVFYPMKMVKPEHVHILKILALDRTRGILALVEKNKNLSQSQLCRMVNLNIRTVMKYASDLVRIGLIKSVTAGKFKRFQITDMANDLKRMYRRRAKRFKEYILRRAKSDGLSPQIVLATPELLKIKLSIGERKKVLTLPLNPFNREQYTIENIGKAATTHESILIPPPILRTQT